MKTKLLKLFLLAIIFLTPNLVRAESACSYAEQAELNDIVALVNATYEPVEIYGGKALDIDNPNEDGSIPEVDYYVKGFNISILNITNDIYVKVTNNKDSNEQIFRYENTTDGEVTFQVKGASSLTTYTIEVYSNKYSCAGDLFRKFSIVTPIYNNFSQLEACSQNPNFYYCQEYIPSETISLQTFFDNLEEYREQNKEETANDDKNKNFMEKIKEFYSNNKATVYTVGIIIVIAGVATTVILIKKRRSRVL